MKGLNWSIVTILLAISISIAIAAPSERVKREDESLDEVSFELNPVASEVSQFFLFYC